jgi:hypothetical protein
MAQVMPQYDREQLRAFLLDAIDRELVAAKIRADATRKAADFRWLPAPGSSATVTSSGTLLDRLDGFDAISASDLDKHMREILVDAKLFTQANNSGGGRPPKYAWDPFWIEIIRIANGIDGLPDQADLVRLMSEWCQKTWGKEPSQSTIKEKISKIYN